MSISLLKSLHNPIYYFNITWYYLGNVNTNNQIRLFYFPGLLLLLLFFAFFVCISFSHQLTFYRNPKKKKKNLRKLFIV